MGLRGQGWCCFLHYKEQISQIVWLSEVNISRFTSINCDKAACLTHSEHGAFYFKLMQNQRFAAWAASAHFNVRFPHYFSAVNNLLWEFLTIYSGKQHWSGGTDGFERTVALSVLAANLHRIGL